MTINTEYNSFKMKANLKESDVIDKPVTHEGVEVGKIVGYSPETGECKIKMSKAIAFPKNNGKLDYSISFDLKDS